MDRLPEFIGNHPWLVAAFVAVLVLLIGSEIARRLRRFKEISPGLATQLINRQNAVVLDVRPAGEFQEGHIAGARNVPADTLQQQDRMLGKLGDKPLILCCASGQRSARAAGWLAANHPAPVFVLAGGLRAWRSDNLPVESGKG